MFKVILSVAFLLVVVLAALPGGVLYAQGLTAPLTSVERLTAAPAATATATPIVSTELGHFEESQGTGLSGLALAMAGDLGSLDDSTLSKTGEVEPAPEEGASASLYDSSGLGGKDSIVKSTSGVSDDSFEVTEAQSAPPLQSSSVLTVCLATVGTCPYTNVQDAVSAAIAGDEIRVAAGTYAGTVTLNKNLTLRGGFTTTNWVTPDPDQNPTTIDAQSSGRVVEVSNGISATVSGFRLTGGSAANGAGVYNYNGTLTLEDNQICGNEAILDNGGGVLNGAPGISATLIIRSNQIYSNTAQFGGGGLSVRLGTVLLEATEIFSNSALDAGGGIFISNGDITVKSSLIYSNTANETIGFEIGGGGIYVDNGNVKLENNTLYENYAEYQGGGIYAWSGTVAITNNLIVSNTAGISGGGIYSNTAGLSVAFTDFFGNLPDHIADPGGAIAPTTIGTSNRITNPLFVDPQNFDLHLSPGSPAIDSGAITTTVTVDYEGDPRPLCGGYDIGADESTHCLGVNFAPDLGSSGVPGQNIVYTHFLTNTGSVSDTFDLTHTLTISGPGTGWSVDYTPAFTLAAGEWAEVPVTLSVPTNAVSGTQAVVVVTAASRTVPRIVDTVVNTTVITSAPAPTWQYSKTVEIYNPGTTGLTDYQVRFDVAYETGMNGDFSDVRFKASPSGDFLPYWTESYTDSTSAVMWVQVPSLPAETTTELTMYYGQPTAEDESDGDAVFEIFDDFEDGVLSDEWTVNNLSSYQEADGKWQVDDPANNTWSNYKAGIYQPFAPATGFHVLVNTFEWVAQSHDLGQDGVYLLDESDSAVAWIGATDAWVDYNGYKWAGVSGDTYSSGKGSLPASGSAKIEIYRDQSNNHTFKWDDEVIKTTTSSSVISTLVLATTQSESYNAKKAYFSDIVVRKYADPEPQTSSQDPEAGFNTYHEDLEATPADGDHPLSTYDIIHFRDESTDDGSIESWSWDYDYDGVTWDEDSTDQHPFHQFSASGSYTVCLTVTDNANLSSSPYCRIINVVDGASLWTKSATVTIDNNGGTALSDYQVKVGLTGDPEGSGLDISDGWPESEGFIRFRGDDGGGMVNLPYWVEEWDSGSKTAVVWVKVKDIPTSSATDMMVYHGYMGARANINESDSDVVFEFFDDFDGGALNGKWTTSGQGSVDVTSGYAYPSSYGSGSWQGPVIIANLPDTIPQGSGFAMAARFFWQHNSGDLGRIYFGLYSNGARRYELRFEDSHTSYAESSEHLYDSSQSLFAACTGYGQDCLDNGQWTEVEIKKLASYLVYRKNGTLRYAGSAVDSEVNQVCIAYSRHSSSYPPVILRTDRILVRKYADPEPVVQDCMWTLLEGGDHCGRDWTVDTNTAIGGEHINVGTLTVANGATLTLQGDTSTGTGVIIHAQNVTVDEGAIISAGGRGYSGSSGPGAGGDASTSNERGGGGGGHGGYGSAGVYGPGGGAGAGGGVYGSVFEPVALGSGGGRGTRYGCTVAGGSGGGAIKLVISDTLTNNGVISADGSAGIRGCDYNAANSGGGSGGSIWIDTDILEGSGSITANGGNSGNTGYAWDAGAGGGGRIAVYYNTNNGFAFDNSGVQAFGGNGYSAVEGGAGAIYLEDKDGSCIECTQLIIDNNNQSGEKTDSIKLGDSFDALILRNRAYVNFEAVTPITPSYSIGNLTLANNATAYFLGNTAEDVGVKIVGQDLSVDATSSMDASGYGYPGGSAAPGPGQGSAGDPGGGGGGYGGIGGDGNPGAGGPEYGSYGDPTQLGSGGGNDTGGAGGGAVVLEMSGTVTLQNPAGSIRADGSDGGTNAGGGSGGSVKITCDVITGTGRISADGGAGQSNGGGGAGGRIAIYCHTNDFGGTLSAMGGSGYSPGGSGTIYFDQVDAAHSAVVAQPTGGLVADGTSTATLTVTLMTPTDLPVSGKQVSLRITQGTANLVNGVPISDSAAVLIGVSGMSGTVTATLATTKAEAKTVAAIGGGVTLSNTAAVTFVAGAPDRRYCDVGASYPNTVPADGTTPVTLVSFRAIMYQ